MKKQTILLAILLSFTFGVKSQITEEKTYSADIFMINVGEAGYMFYEYDEESYTFNYYNIDHSVYKSITIDTSQLNLPAGYNLEVFSPFYITDKLFDLDSDVDFMMSLSAFSGDYSVNLSAILIYNENGEIEYREDGVSIKWNQTTQQPESIFNTQGGTKMILATDNETKVYNLPGNLPCNLCESGTVSSKSSISKSKESTLKSYPNPANEYSRIDYQLPANTKTGTITLFDLNGNTIKEYLVDKNFDHLKINTADFPAGTYIYTLKTDNGISKGQKMVIIK